MCVASCPNRFPYLCPNNRITCARDKDGCVATQGRLAAAAGAYIGVGVSCIVAALMTAGTMTAGCAAAVVAWIFSAGEVALGVGVCQAPDAELLAPPPLLR